MLQPTPRDAHGTIDREGSRKKRADKLTQMLSLTDDELAAQSVRPRSRHETFSPAARSL